MQNRHTDEFVYVSRVQIVLKHLGDVEVRKQHHTHKNMSFAAH